MTVKEFIDLCVNGEDMWVNICVLDFCVFEGVGSDIPDEYKNSVIGCISIGHEAVLINLYNTQQNKSQFRKSGGLYT